MCECAISGKKRSMARKKTTSTNKLLVTGAMGLAGYIAANYLGNKVPFLGNNLLIKAGAKVVAGVITATSFKGSEATAAGVGMIINGGKDVVTQYAPTLGLQGTPQYRRIPGQRVRGTQYTRNLVTDHHVAAKANVGCPSGVTTRGGTTIIM